MLRLVNVRYRSSLSKLWIKHNGNQATQVSTAGCLNISDFAEAVKKKLPKQLSAFDSNQLTLHKSLTDAPFEPDFLLSSISDAGLSAKFPLFVKTQESITATQKTIFVRDIDEECRPVDSFTEVVVENDVDLKQIFARKGEALYLPTNPKTRITKFRQLIDGETYNVYSRWKDCCPRVGCCF